MFKLWCSFIASFDYVFSCPDFLTCHFSSLGNGLTLGILPHLWCTFGTQLKWEKISDIDIFLIWLNRNVIVQILLTFWIVILFLSFEKVYYVSRLRTKSFIFGRVFGTHVRARSLLISYQKNGLTHFFHICCTFGT